MDLFSDLRERQRQAGAVFATQTAAGEQGLPLHYGDPAAECAAATQAAAVFDWTNHALLELTGADRATFLHNFCTNEIRRLKPGEGCEAFITNVKGRILGHVWVSVGPTSIWLDAGPGPVDRLVAHLERYIINEDVQVADRTSTWGELLVMGPAADAKLAALGMDAKSLSPLDHVQGGVANAPGLVQIIRRDIGSQSAYVVWMPVELLGAVWTELTRAGVRPAGSAVWSGMRIDAGLPIYGVDLSDENLAQEAGRSQAISFTKGCYLGQEPIARIDAMGHVNRELRCLWIEGDAVPASGARVFGEMAPEQSVGTITSVAFSSGRNRPVAMGLLRSSVIDPGARVMVEVDADRVPATVFWPLVERPG